jgi:hypothetical protein
MSITNCLTPCLNISNGTSIGSNVNSDINIMTEDQQHMWDILTYDPERLCHHWAKDIMKSKRYMHRRADHYIGIMLDQFSVEDMSAVLCTWLRTYKIPLIPIKLKNFDEFHNRCGSYVHSTRIVGFV